MPFLLTCGGFVHWHSVRSVELRLGLAMTCHDLPLGRDIRGQMPVGSICFMTALFTLARLSSWLLVWLWLAPSTASEDAPTTASTEVPRGSAWIIGPMSWFRSEGCARTPRVADSSLGRVKVTPCSLWTQSVRVASCFCTSGRRKWKVRRSNEIVSFQCLCSQGSAAFGH